MEMITLYVVGAVIVGAVTSGWHTTRDAHQEWSAVSPLSAWLYNWLVVFLAALAWPLVVAGGISYGLLRLLESWWNSDLSVLKDPDPELTRQVERRKLEKSIAELEAELEIQQTVVGELGELPERPFIWIKTPTQN